MVKLVKLQEWTLFLHFLYDSSEFIQITMIKISWTHSSLLYLSIDGEKGFLKVILMKTTKMRFTTTSLTKELRVVLIWLL